MLKDPERVRVGLDRLIEEERTSVGRDPGRDTEFWSKKLTEAEDERRGYHRLAANGHMSEEELTAALADLDEARESAEREIATACARGGGAPALGARQGRLDGILRWGGR